MDDDKLIEALCEAVERFKNPTVALETVTTREARRLPDGTRLVPCHPNGSPRLGEQVRVVERGDIKMPVPSHLEQRFLVFRSPPPPDEEEPARPFPSDPTDPFSDLTSALRDALAGASFRIEDDGGNGLARIVSRQQRRMDRDVLSDEALRRAASYPTTEEN